MAARGDGSAPDGVIAEGDWIGLQLVSREPVGAPPIGDIVELTAADAPAMRTLAELTKPGPFNARTHEFGGFWGVKRAGRLVAMAGERLKQPGFTEVSGVCVDPAHRGAGDARTLSALVAARIQARGETPYLHAYADNPAAIALYESLGFRIRAEKKVAQLRRSAA